MDPAVPQSGPSTPVLDKAIGSVVRARCQGVLKELLSRSPGVMFASVSTVDGRSVAHSCAPAHPSDGQRVAAIMTSLMALTESFSREALKSRTLYNTTTTEDGSLIMARVPSRGKAITLCVCVDTSENLAMALRITLDTAAILATHINSLTSFKVRQGDPG